jgi:hypothetical protein
MATPDKSKVYRSAVRFDENRIRAAAIYCSDGRYGEQIDDFLHVGLKLPRCDRLVVPGGPACLAGHFLAFREEDGLIEQFRFLIHVHDIQRVVLIAHQDCAFYGERLHVPSSQRETRQHEDLCVAAERLRAFSRHVAVDRFFARKLDDGTVCFEPVA